jgi:hypothetical protein
MGNGNRVYVGLILLVLMAAFLSGQFITAKIVGNVKDENGKYLSKAEVTVTNINTNAVMTTTTGKKGTFRLLGLPPGWYQVSFDLEGYQSYVASGIQLNAEQSVTLRIKLKKME